MRSSFFLAALAASNTVAAINILLSSDDSFESAPLRELKRLLTEDGHKAIVVATAVDQSGQGTRSVYAEKSTLNAGSPYGSVAAGAPSLARSPDDPDVWYYNGTPAATVFVALDYVIPQYYNGLTVDLYAGGPNFGNNVGVWHFTSSGTLGGAIAAISRGIPGIAFSTGNNEERGYKSVSGKDDPSTIQAKLARDIIRQLVKGTEPGQKIFAPSYGLNVNTPQIASSGNGSCTKPKFFQTIMTGGASTQKAVYNSGKGTFTGSNSVESEAVNTCLNGPCNLPGEAEVLRQNCEGSVSVFTIDYDAPLGEEQHDIRAVLSPLVAFDRPSHGRRHVREF